jgi:hypothetical protein
MRLPRHSILQFVICIAAGALSASAEDDFDESAVQPKALTADQISILNRNAFESWLQVEVRYRVDDYRARYDLTESQQTRLSLACQADVRRVSDAVKNPQHVANVRQPAMKLFGPDSFVSKAIYKILTADQTSKYRQDIDERMRLQHRSNIEGVIREFERHVVLSIPQQEAIVDLFMCEIRPPEKESDTNLATLRVQISELPDESLMPIFDDDQWPKIRKVLESYEKAGAPHPDPQRPLRLIDGVPK